MTKLWFTSDTHFGHENILKLAGRPFPTIGAMDDAIIANWNERVGRGDTVWHLGDFAHRHAGSIAGLRARLNGKIHLIVGNHDRDLIAAEPELFASIQQLTELRVGEKTLVLCHYPLREWDMAWRGAWHLFGHVHTRLQDDPLGYSLDVGVDSHAYAPIDLSAITSIMATRTNPFVDPVGPDGRRRRPLVKTVVTS